MRQKLLTSRLHSLSPVLSLVAASIACLCAGALLAVERDGLPRLIFAGGGFAGYLFFFAHALRELGLPSAVSGDAPDGERRPEEVPRSAPNARPRRRTLLAAVLAALFIFEGESALASSGPSTLLRKGSPCSTPSSSS